jgi:hypothetical protein
MGVDRLPIHHIVGFGSQRFQADIVCAARDRTLDASGQQLLECRERDVLQVDGQRQQPIEEGGDRRQLVPDAGAR